MFVASVCLETTIEQDERIDKTTSRHSLDDEHQRRRLLRAQIVAQAIKSQQRLTILDLTDLHVPHFVPIIRIAARRNSESQAERVTSHVPFAIQLRAHRCDTCRQLIAKKTYLVVDRRQHHASFVVLLRSHHCQPPTTHLTTQHSNHAPPNGPTMPVVETKPENEEKRAGGEGRISVRRQGTGEKPVSPHPGLYDPMLSESGNHLEVHNPAPRASMGSDSDTAINDFDYNNELYVQCGWIKPDKSAPIDEPEEVRPTTQPLKVIKHPLRRTNTVNEIRITKPKLRPELNGEALADSAVTTRVPRGIVEEDSTEGKQSPVPASVKKLQRRTSAENASTEEKDTVPASLEKAPPKTRRVTAWARVQEKIQKDQNFQMEIMMGRRIGFYKIVNEIGRERVAIKVLDKLKLDVKAQRLLAGEVPNLERLHHPNIIRVYEMINTANKVFIVMEFAPLGELYGRIMSTGPYSEEQAKPLFAQIVAALDHMHRRNICHRDLKAENVFLITPTVVKIGDFGFSVLHNRYEPLKTFCGSPPYAAPELYKSKSYFGEYVDVWASAVLLYFMVAGKLPFRGGTMGQLKAKILDTDYEIPSYFSHELIEIVSGILVYIPTERMSLFQVKQSEWLGEQVFPEEIKKYKINPMAVGGEAAGAAESVDEDEKIAHQKLRELGIDDELIMQSEKKDSRSSITGTYRILLHRQHRTSRKESRLEINGVQDIVANNDLLGNIREESCKTLPSTSIAPSGDTKITTGAAAMPKSALVSKPLPDDPYDVSAKLENDKYAPKIIPKKTGLSKFCVIL